MRLLKRKDLNKNVPYKVLRKWALELRDYIDMMKRANKKQAEVLDEYRKQITDLEQEVDEWKLKYFSEVVYKPEKEGEPVITLNDERCAGNFYDLSKNAKNAK